VRIRRRFRCAYAGGNRDLLRNRFESLCSASDLEHPPKVGVAKNKDFVVAPQLRYQLAGSRTPERDRSGYGCRPVCHVPRPPVAVRVGAKRSGPRYPMSVVGWSSPPLSGIDDKGISKFQKLSIKIDRARYVTQEVVLVGRVNHPGRRSWSENYRPHSRRRVDSRLRTSRLDPSLER